MLYIFIIYNVYNYIHKYIIISYIDCTIYITQLSLLKHSLLRIKILTLTI